MTQPDTAPRLSIEMLAAALYETDPPESWMATGTDEYRKRAAWMLEIIERDGGTPEPFAAAAYERLREVSE